MAVSEGINGRVSSDAEDNAVTKIQKDNSTATFHLFPNLPKELCFEIWKIFDADNTPARIIGVEVCKIKEFTGLKFKSSEKVPTILHVSREARHLGLQRYATALNTPVDGPCIYMDPDVDVLVMKLALDRRSYPG